MQDSNFIYYKNTIAVTNRHLCTCPLTEQLKKVCSVHPRAIILREKDLSEDAYLSLAEEVLSICAKENVPCILHNQKRSLLVRPIFLQVTFMLQTAKKDFHRADLISYNKSANT